MRLDDVNKGIHKNRKRLRVGRGPGSGRGKTSGRGHKGQGQLAGWSASAIFEGARKAIAALPRCKPYTLKMPVQKKVQRIVLEGSETRLVTEKSTVTDILKIL